MKLKPIMKLNDSKSHLVPWILDKFPEGYRGMTYLEPFLGAGSVLLNKDPSVEEVANDIDAVMVDLWRAVRDEPKEFVSKTKRMEYKESTFLRCQKSTSSDFLPRGKDDNSHAEGRRNGHMGLLILDISTQVLHLPHSSMSSPS